MRTRTTAQSIKQRCTQLGIDVDVSKCGNKLRYIFAHLDGSCAFVNGTHSATRFLDGYVFSLCGGGSPVDQPAQKRDDTSSSHGAGK